MRKLSGLQKDVISLYRLVLRTARTKDAVPYAKSRFRAEAGEVARMDFKRIEHGLRQGHKYVKLMGMPGVKLVQGTGGVK
ncbi:hypothetical protein TeGR_g8591 [Tetraparma gracilis]|uniref:Uncharacterized protein n=1 Tax=Tetraparma gracilis TaxID=2962635 RepID=A0ABQ6N2Q0_9STRA|nr:hypothetical protein TeGR_g8591 [Tetraparma gracilis]